MHPYDPYLLFDRQARQRPASIALNIDGRDHTYAELHERALAHAVWCEAHTPPAARVAVFGRKTMEAYAAILGILRSGRSYVPLHPAHPPARWFTMLEKAEVKAGFITQDDRHLMADIDRVEWYSDPEEKITSDPAVVSEDAEAYVMFTSGSTGGPKGVPVGRSQVAHYLQHQLVAYPFDRNDRFTQFFALTFDLSVHDLFVCWGCGGCLCVPDDDAPLRAAQYANDQRITSWFSVPSLAQVMRRMRALRPGSLPDLRHAFFCGEALPAEVAGAWKKAASASRIINLYGPTETTIAITGYEFQESDPAGIVPLGKPFHGHLAVVERDGDLHEQGEGELLVSGPQLNSGYLKDDDATAKAFIQRDGDRWYRTGDRVRIDDGIIHFLGRIDDQVKIMGHRVEPAEVDAVLAALLQGGMSVTIPAGTGPAIRLITFIDALVDQAELFRVLRDALPPYMIPEKIIRIKEFSYSAHGKLDRAALIAMAGEQ